jgi:hypothetical protein
MVGVHVADLADRVPAFPELQERFMHEVGGVVSIPGDEGQRLEQAPMLVLVERPEVSGATRGLVELHHLTLCLHHPFPMPQSRLALRKRPGWHANPGPASTPGRRPRPIFREFVPEAFTALAIQ